MDNVKLKVDCSIETDFDDEYKSAVIYHKNIANQCTINNGSLWKYR